MKLKKTETGLRVLKDRSVPLTPRQRAAFILFDGKSTVDQVLAATGGGGVTREDVDHLLASGLLAPVDGTTVEPVASLAAAAPAAGTAAPVQAPTPVEAPAAAEPVADSGRSPQQRYQDAYPIATRLTASLGLRGFRLNLAVEAALNVDQLRELGPRIREAVGEKAYRELDQALND